MSRLLYFPIQRLYPDSVQPVVCLQMSYAFGIDRARGKTTRSEYQFRLPRNSQVHANASRTCGRIDRESYVEAGKKLEKQRRGWTRLQEIPDHRSCAATPP
jgi:hypothetical protein